MPWLQQAVTSNRVIQVMLRFWSSTPMPLSRVAVGFDSVYALSRSVFTGMSALMLHAVIILIFGICRFYIW